MLASRNHQEISLVLPIRSQSSKDLPEEVEFMSVNIVETF